MKRPHTIVVYKGSLVTGLLAITLALIPVSALPAPRPAGRATPKPETNHHNLSLAVAAAIVQKAIADYQTSTSDPKLKSADITFKVTSGGSLGGSITFWIFTIGMTKTDTEIQEVSFSYEVPDPTKPPASPSAVSTPPSQTASTPPEWTALNPEVAQAESERFFNQLSFDTLAQTKNSTVVEKATPKGGLQPDMDKFEQKLVMAIREAAKASKKVRAIGLAKFKSFAVTIEYSVKLEGSGSVSVPVFTIVTIGPKGNINHETAHSLKLVFTPSGG
jgi:hypothetical protein